jgi:hypothetical protein
MGGLRELYKNNMTMAAVPRLKFWNNCYVVMLFPKQTALSGPATQSPGFAGGSGLYTLLLRYEGRVE